MPSLSLAPPQFADFRDLLAFELGNRAFFESTINARPPDYYSAQGIERAIQTAIDDARHDRGYQYLIKSEGGDIIGRINFSGVKRDHFHCAVLGYRIAESACGRGHASQAVRQALEIAFDELGLLRIEADTRPENTGSVRVLVRNGFVQFGHSKRSFQLHGEWYDRLHFERHAQCDS
jgi:ribosomal-protein-alanine N-acetyltransferase